MVKTKLILAGILLLGLTLRLYGVWWDSGYHLHPDERMLIMVADRIHFFNQLDPDFFNYGSLPIYILKAVAQLIDAIFGTLTANYDGLLFVGRILSVAADLTTCFLVFNIGKMLFRKSSYGLWASFLYTIAFFPIQNSHFFVVDVFLTLFVTCTLFFLLRYRHLPNILNLICIAFFCGAALATKASAIIILPLAIGFTILPSFLDLCAKHHKSIFPLSFFILKNIVLFLIFTIIFFIIFMPFAYLRMDRFVADVMAQIRMNSNPYVFPYTLQYVDTTAYIYYLKNIFYWGLGPVISTGVIAGFIFLLKNLYHHLKEKNHMNWHRIRCIFVSPELIVFTLGMVYFLVIGRSAVKFMRYMLPLYPLFILVATYGFIRIAKSLSHLRPKITSLFFIIVNASAFFLTSTMVQIYSTPNTRIQATEWIKAHISPGATLAVEHWDDRVPIYDGGLYQYVEMTLYELPDNTYKWQLLNDKLQSADYIILASNRLYVPLQRLNNCSKYDVCYPLTATYYQELFAGRRGFTKVAEFTSYPRMRIGTRMLQLVDDEADESFTVYDHPKIMIFKKN